MVPRGGIEPPTQGFSVLCYLPTEILKRMFYSLGTKPEGFA